MWYETVALGQLGWMDGWVDGCLEYPWFVWIVTIVSLNVPDAPKCIIHSSFRFIWLVWGSVHLHQTRGVCFDSMCVCLCYQLLDWLKLCCYVCVFFLRLFCRDRIHLNTLLRGLNSGLWMRDKVHPPPCAKCTNCLRGVIKVGGNFTLLFCINLFLFSKRKVRIETLMGRRYIKYSGGGFLSRETST